MLTESLVPMTENLMAMSTRDLETLAMRTAEILSSRDYMLQRKGQRKGWKGRSPGKRETREERTLPSAGSLNRPVSRERRTADVRYQSGDVEPSHQRVFLP